MLPKFKLFPSPYSGILFLLADALGYDIVFKKFPSPYSGILFLYSYKSPYQLWLEKMFPSPYSGILFLSLSETS